MKVIAPTPITDARLVSSSVPETDHPEWAAGTSYAAGARVIVAAAHDRYEALTSNAGKPPAANPSDWLLLGKTNRWAMFDQKVGTVTAATGSITVTLAPGIVNAVALLSIGGATSLRVRMIDATEGVVYDRSTALYDPGNVVDWWTYFFEDVRLKAVSVALDLPTYRDTQVEITLTGPATETVSIGACVIGRLHSYGPQSGIHLGASAGIQDYSRKTRDDWGNVEVVERAFSKRARWAITLPNGEIDVFQARMAALRATPAVYIGSERYASTVVYGFFRDFDVVIAYPAHSECSIEIEGLV